MSNVYPRRIFGNMNIRMLSNLLITFYLIFQANVRMATHALKTVITFIMKCMNVTAIEVMSSVTMVTAALVSFQFS